jgi:hypothetical protein
MPTTVARALLDEALPDSLRGHGDLDKAGIRRLFQAVADQRPDEYRHIAQRLMDVGREVSTATGGYSFGLDDIRPGPSAVARRNEIRRRLDQILDDPASDDASREHQIVELLSSHLGPLEADTYRDAMAANNPAALQVTSGTRGNKSNLKSLLSGDLMYSDQQDRPIPMPILHSYSEGLTPAEYWAASYGARRGVIDTKLSTASSGYLSKQFNQAVHRLVVVDDDYKDGQDRSHIGLPVDAADSDNLGALLARQAGPYPRDTVITPAVMRGLRDAKVDRILVRSPTVGGPANGGVYAKDVGIREKGVLAPRHDYVGIAAGQALTEALTQGALGSKHSGGVAGANNAISGFKLVDQLAQVPEAFRGGVTHAQLDGRVTDVRAAAHGGHQIVVSGKTHYVPPDRQPTVKPGDDVEAGDALSTGVPNPAELVRHKGIGEGRRKFVEIMLDAYHDSGMPADRRNIELLARGLINHVQLDRETDAAPDAVPGDVIQYHALAARWQPRDGSREVIPSSAVGRYLEAPALHYTIGTQIKPSMAAELQRFGIAKVTIHNDPPPFEPHMIRAAALLQHDPDWMTRHLGSNLKRVTLDAVHRGLTSDSAGTSFVPAVVDRVTFGRHGETRGYDPAEVRGPRDGDGDGFVYDGKPHMRPK